MKKEFLRKKTCFFEKFIKSKTFLIPMAAYIAILGDIHGHYTLAATLLKRWEKEKGKTLDAVLQVGDMGIFPFPDRRIDDATRRFAEKDPDEISFRDFYLGEGDAQLLFDGEKPFFDHNFIFIRGNHEDFEFLIDRESIEELSPVDAYFHFLYLADGGKTQIETGSGLITIAGLGGLEQGYGERQQPWHFSNVRYKRILVAEGIDILLTHHPPLDGSREKGSQMVRELLETVQPTYHFCGHYHDPGQQLSIPGRTQSYILNEVNFRGQRILYPGSIGILEWENSLTHSFSFVNEHWMKEYTRANYREKLKEMD